LYHEILTRAEAKAILLSISAEQYNKEQIASFMTVFQMRPITAEELGGFRDALLELRARIDLGGRETIDIVGTGGDGKNTFNISTTSAFVIAGAGYKVTKHGSYGVSSSTGSSDVLMGLGYEFTNDEARLLKQVDEAGICFFHAPLFHPAMKAVVPVRKALRTKSFFNMLGPLISPAQPKYQLFGTFNLEVARLYQEILTKDEKQFTVVYDLNGYDEISLTSSFQIRQVNRTQILSPADLGLPTYQMSDLDGGEGVADAQKILISILSNKATPAQKSAVMANAGLAIHTIHPEKSLQDCVAEAKESIERGSALATLQKVVTL